MTSTCSRQALWHWFLLTRPWNVLSMGIMVWLVMRWLGHAPESFWAGGQLGWLVVPMLVGAAGNVINDYFDIREDRINKPAKTHIGRTVKRRVAMASHWGLSLVALGWSAWLSSEVGNLLPLGIAFTFTVLLYVYSPMLKGRGAWGNLAISICVGGLVLWAAVGAGRAWECQWLNGWCGLGLLLAAMNFIREWVKDIQDMQGDIASHHRTMAIQLSKLQNRRGILGACLVTWIAGCIWAIESPSTNSIYAIWAMVGIGCMQRAFVQNYRSLSAWIKVWMGLLFLMILG